MENRDEPVQETPDARRDAGFDDVRQLLERHRVLEIVARRQESPRSGLLQEMQHRQNIVELQRHLGVLHPADIAHLLESLPAADRLIVWEALPVPIASLALVEASTSVREALITETARPRLLAICRALDADDLRYLAESLPDDVVEEVTATLDMEHRHWIEQAEQFDENTAAHLMLQDPVRFRVGDTVQDAVALVRRYGRLPTYTDRLFVVDARNILVGSVPLGVLLIAEPSAPIASVMDTQVRPFHPADTAADVARAFERYDLLSAPVVDERGKLIGRVTADAVVDFIRGSSDNEALALAGLRKAEDLFAPAIDSARNRWPWLAVNLATAFIASRVIGRFEPVIQQLVALATLMPIVASIGGNTGNQTVALVVRGIAVDQIGRGTERHLLRKELTISLLNGAVWGSIVGIFAAALYHSLALGLVMAAAVLLNLVVAAVVGVAVPLVLHRLDRDPAQGSSVVLTFATDSMGFFLFLGLASLFLQGP